MDHDDRVALPFSSTCPPTTREHTGFQGRRKKGIASFRCNHMLLAVVGAQSSLFLLRGRVLFLGL